MPKAQMLPGLPMDEPGYEDDLKRLVVDVNGLLYYGERMEAIIMTLRVLRADPELAASLLR